MAPISPKPETAETAGKPRLSILCPVFNEESAVPLFVDRLSTALESITREFAIELIFIDNCSTDSTLDIISTLRESIFEIYYIRMARNFGYQSSLICGLTHATGEIIVSIDADCEDPPELIPQFLDGWKSGYDIVYGVRRGRPESAALTAARRIFYRGTRVIADADFVLDMAEFLLMTAEVRDAVLQSRTSYPFIRSEIGYVGFRRKGIPYDRQPRIAGVSNYTLFGLVRFAVAGMLSSSTAPLRIAAYLGLPLFILNIVFSVLVILDRPRFGTDGVVLLDMGFLVLAISFLSIYVARTYKNGLMRPLFVVDRKLSLLPPRAPHSAPQPAEASSLHAGGSRDFAGR
jgi:glycosyltransferase involved in cell wall biosynthesis